jgi:hypothetical protein
VNRALRIPAFRITLVCLTASPECSPADIPRVKFATNCPTGFVDSELAAIIATTAKAVGQFGESAGANAL